ncbi:MAG: MaoC family dehydratase [Alphaproteobacteria bacterium]|nr:MaoC family dehydratase [Alphaproteobacteria bacterium]
MTPSYYLEDLTIGMTANLSKTITATDIALYADVSSDTNPVHLDENFAKNTIFKKPIAHGLLSAGLISAVFGTKLPGPGAIYIMQNLKFKAPVYIGDTVTATVTVTGIDQEKARVSFETICTVGQTVVIAGDAQLMVPRKSK